MSFEDFEKKAHQKRVDHFVKYIHAHTHKATIQECMEVFGFCREEASPIYTEATAKAFFS